MAVLFLSRVYVVIILGGYMARRMGLDDAEVLSLRIERSMHLLLKDLAAVETAHTGRLVFVPELIRAALNFVFNDNERLRECFRRAREVNKRKFK
jgi:hypothetical protein